MAEVIWPFFLRDAGDGSSDRVPIILLIQTLANKILDETSVNGDR